MAITANPTNWAENGTLTLSGTTFSNRTLFVLTDDGSGETFVTDGVNELFSDPDRPNTIIATNVSADVIDLTKFQVDIRVNDAFNDNMTFTGSTLVRNVLVGGGGADILTGGNQNDQLDGGGNADTLIGGGGIDNLLGNSGNDTITGGAGADTMSGGNNDDTFVYLAATDIVTGETVNGGADTDTLRFLHNGVLDFRPATPTGIERIEFASANLVGVTRVIFNASQFGDTGISNALQLVGGPDDDRLEVRLTAPGTFSAAGWSLTSWTDLIEIFGTSGADTITGSNSIFGDDIEGGDGADNLDGGEGGDTFIVNSTDVDVGEVINGGIDTGQPDTDRIVLVSNNATTDLTAGTLIGIEQVTFNLRVNATLQLRADQIGAGAITQVVSNPGDHVHSLVVVASGGRDADLSAVTFTGWGGPDERVTINGDLSDQTFIGSNQDDVLNGGGGADTMIGGVGDDSYLVSEAGDTANENANEGDDRVFANISFALGPNVERLNLQAGTSATGNELDNTIFGNGADNVIDGGGGADAMNGITGSDQYFVDNAGDTITEGSGNGAFDRIFTSTSYTLAGTLEIEMVSTTDHFGTAAINITGNFRSEFIIGNDGDNIIDGGGGLDTLWGRSGNDQYIVRDAGAVVFDDAGFDRIFATTSYVLGGSDTIEMITTTDHFGTTAINLSGNFRAEYIIGNDGANIIDGGGGADTLWGRAGNDQYIVNDAGAVVFEESGAGIDRVFAGVSYTLGDGAEVETFTTTDHSGTAAINLTGNFRADYILGNAGNNIINGGSGADTLSGNGGADKFLFNTSLVGGNIDVIEDFVAADDSFWLDNAVFGGLTDGVLAESAFRAGTAAADADDRIVYDSTTGNVFFDADGTGATAAVQFAHVTPGSSMVFNSFLIL